MRFTFTGRVWFWRGPAPWYFVTVPADEGTVIKEESAALTYGWGMIPATVRIGRTEWDTALWEKDGRYIVPLKAAVRRAEGLELDDAPTVTVVVRPIL